MCSHVWDPGLMCLSEVLIQVNKTLYLPEALSVLKGFPPHLPHFAELKNNEVLTQVFYRASAVTQRIIALLALEAA